MRKWADTLTHRRVHTHTLCNMWVYFKREVSKKEFKKEFKKRYVFLVIKMTCEIIKNTELS